MNIFSGVSTDQYAPVGILPDRVAIVITKARWCLYRFPSRKPSEYKRHWKTTLAVHFMRHDGEEVKEPYFVPGPPCINAYPVNVGPDGNGVLPAGIDLAKLQYLASDEGDNWWPPDTTDDNVREKVLEMAVATEGTHLSGPDGYKLPKGSNLYQFVEALQTVTNGALNSASELDGRSFVLEKVNNTNEKGKPFHVFTSELQGGQTTPAPVAQPAAAQPTAQPVAAPVVQPAAAPVAPPPATSIDPNVDTFMLTLVSDAPDGLTKAQALQRMQAMKDDGRNIAERLKLFHAGLSAGTGTGWAIQNDKLVLAL